VTPTYLSLRYDVTQKAVLGSVMYITAITDMHNVHVHNYADDLPFDRASWLLRSTSTAQILRCRCCPSTE